MKKYLHLTISYDLHRHHCNLWSLQKKSLSKCFTLLFYWYVEKDSLVVNWCYLDQNNKVFFNRHFMSFQLLHLDKITIK